MFRPHPFSWVPAEGKRHATTDAKPRYGYRGTRVRTLCGRSVFAEDSDVAWLWPTWPGCNEGAHDLAEVPMIGSGAPGLLELE